ncbi:MAG: hypothetical protein ACRDL0_22415 [Thermoleophilaceae bacterium]
MDRAAFYQADAGPLEQGDLLLAPLVRPINPAELGPCDHFARTPWRTVGEGVSLEGAPPYKALTTVQAAMVVSHDCHIDKQYNRRVEYLHRRQGTPLAEARREAEADRTLDRWIVVSPVVPLDAVRADETAIVENRAVGLFYLPVHPAGVIAEPAVADLSVKFTVDRTLTQRTACLSGAARDEMRMVLMRVALSRRPAWDAVEHVLNSKLIDVVVDQRHPLQVTLRFANGEEFSLVHPPTAETSGGRTRP